MHSKASKQQLKKLLNSLIHMEKIIFEKTNEIRKNIENLENKLNVKIEIKKKLVSIDGSPLDEYEAFIILNAINFGFSANKALLLKDHEMIFKLINIKDFTRKKNLKEVRGRIIGKDGKTLRVLENLSEAEIIVKDNQIGVIGYASSINYIETALHNLIRGTKQANIYKYLERTNKRKKEQGLGLKTSK